MLPTIGHPWVLTGYVAIGLFQTFLAYEAGVLAVMALPPEKATPRTQRRYLRLFLCTGIALFLLTVLVGALNDKNQTDTDRLNQRTADNTDLIRDSIDNNLLPKLRQTSEAIQRGDLPGALHASDEATSIAVNLSNRNAVHTPQSTPPDHALTSTPSISPPAISPPASRSLPDNSASPAGTPAGVTAASTPAAGAGEKEAALAPVPSAPRYVLRLTSLKPMRADPKVTWSFIAWLDDKPPICEFAWQPDTDLSTACPVYQLPATGPWKFRTTIDGNGESATIVNFNRQTKFNLEGGYPVIEIPQTEATYKVLLGDHPRFDLTFSVSKQ